MATIIKLTYTITGKTTLINADKITTAFRIFEKSTRKYATSGVGEDFHEKLENNYNDAYQPRQQYAPRKRNYGYQQQNNQRW